jgi:hypothetical protein
LGLRILVGGGNNLVVLRHFYDGKETNL